MWRGSATLFVTLYLLFRPIPISVEDPLYFGTDPDPRIRTSVYRIWEAQIIPVRMRIQMRIRNTDFFMTS